MHLSSLNASVKSSFNNTFIALIPKVDVPQSASQFRPIALCNFSYKIITKIISTRLKRFMPMLISENQSAFVSDRQIQDNILVTHELFHRLKLLKSGDSGEFALKLDMIKAYDRVDWGFLKAVLLKMGFHHSWVQLVMGFRGRDSNQQGDSGREIPFPRLYSYLSMMSSLK